MAGPLGVTHLFLFSRSNAGNTNLRIALTPRGPTLHFRVEQYSLCKDIAKAQKHPRAGGIRHTNSPLLVMNNVKRPQELSSHPIQKQLEDLTTTIFQNLFPQISSQETRLSSIQRIVLLDRLTFPMAGPSYVFQLRHYAITTRRMGIPKRIRRLDPREQRHRDTHGGAIPNLGKLNDMSEYLLDETAGGFSTASETELDTDAEVEILQTQTRRVLTKKQQQQKLEHGKGRPKLGKRAASNVEKCAVKLVELGPRLKLRLLKVEEGVCEGKVMWNELVTKSKSQAKELDERWEQRRKEKEERKQQQKENIEQKRKLRANTKANAKGDGNLGDKDAGASLGSEDEWTVDTDIEDELENAD